MKRFIFSLLIIFSLWFAIDRAGELAMWWLNQRSQDTTSPKIKNIVEGLTEDVILMGTSRCNSHYVSSIISDTLKMSVYNAGIDGSDNIFAQYMALCYVLQKHTPKVICLEVQNSFLEEEDDLYHTTGYFAPYFGQCAKADSVYHMAGTYWLYKLSHLYRYNTKVLANITGQVKSHWNSEGHGYNPNPKPEVMPELTTLSSEEMSVNRDKRLYMERFVKACKENNVFLCFTISPAYSIVDSSYYSNLKAFAVLHHIPLLDYHSIGLYTDKPDYFKDSFHFWDKGARLYSSKFACDLNQLIRASHKKRQG